MAALAVAGLVALSSFAAGSVDAEEMTEARGVAPITEGAEIYLGACYSCHGAPRAQLRRDSSTPANASVLIEVKFIERVIPATSSTP